MTERASSFFVQIYNWSKPCSVAASQLVSFSATTNGLPIRKSKKAKRRQPILDYSNTFHSKPKFREKMKGEM